MPLCKEESSVVKWKGGEGEGGRERDGEEVGIRSDELFLWTRLGIFNNLETK